MIVLGFDGMDAALTRELMAAGKLPNFAKLAAQGGFSPLGTSVPPQSPVAWSNFITGMDSGGHGIYDFIHRDPRTMIPYLSTSRAEPGRSIELGKWKLPLSGGRVELLRKGRAFWEVLEKHGIETTIIRMPGNFPPSGTASRELAGMGTPDILGTYGTFALYTSDLPRSENRDVAGGKIHEVGVGDNVVRAKLYGPDNPFLVEREKVSADFTVYVDPAAPVAKLTVGSEERIIQVGEWTDWVRVDFRLVPTRSLRGICRFYLQEVRPRFRLYVTPINLDPIEPALPVSSPASYAAELAEATGRFYTQGMPEDTKALSAGVFSRDEFLAQARLAAGENLQQFKVVLDRFQSGFLFYYFGNVDLISHMMWRARDPGHPAYDAEKDAPYAEVIEGCYQELDAIAGYTLDRLGAAATLIVMSDHGFAPWRRSFQLNRWLAENGYLTLKDPDLQQDPGLFRNVDWSRTRAYGLGLNGLYINVRGREKHGIVSLPHRESLAKEIAEKLRTTVDPQTGMPAITKVYLRDEVYRDRGELEIGPDLIVGYAKGTRCSNDSALGGVGGEVFADNTDEWSGDHAMDHETVPGILLANRPLRTPVRDLKQLAAAILAEFEIEPPAPPVP